MNKGVIVYSGQVSATNMAVGDHASASGTGPVSGDLAEKLGQLIKLIADANLPSERQQSLLQAVEVIRTEPAGNKSSVASAMDLLAKAAPMVSGMASLVGAVTGIVQAMQ
jgi:hypothetical protein